MLLVVEPREKRHIVCVAGGKLVQGVEALVQVLVYRVCLNCNFCSRTRQGFKRRWQFDIRLGGGERVGLEILSTANINVRAKLFFEE